MAEAALLDAETDTIEQVSTPSTPPPAGPKRMGRPPGTLLNNELAPEDFFALLNDIGDAEWSKSLCYVWRRDPFTDNTNGGREPKYVDVINRAVTEKDIKEEHGSGTYKLQLNTKDRYHAHTILSLEDPKYPPHIPPGDWFNHPRNKKWTTWKPLVEKWWKDKLVSLATPTAAPSTDGAALGELTRLISQLANNNGKSADGDKLQSTLVSWALQQTADSKKAEREADNPDKLTAMIRAIKELSPTPAPPPPPDNTMLQFLLAQLTRVQESNDSLVKMMLTQKATESKAPDPLAMVDTVSSIFAKLQGFVQPSEPKHWAENVAETLGPKILDLTSQIVQVNAMAQRMNPGNQPRGTQQPGPGRNVIPAQAQPVYPSPPPPQSANPPQAAPPVEVQDQPAPAVEMDTMQRSMLTNIAALTQAALNLGLPGDEFAEQMCRKFGDIAYEKFVSSIDQEQLIPLFRSIPEAWAFLQPYEPDLPSFVESFYAFSEPPEDEDAKSISLPVEEPEPVLKSPKPSKKKAK